MGLKVEPVCTLNSRVQQVDDADGEAYFLARCQLSHQVEEGKGSQAEYQRLQEQEGRGRGEQCIEGEEQEEYRAEVYREVFTLRVQVEFRRIVEGLPPVDG